jgi:ABC-2 type transport system ATP-binding protein
LPASVGAHGGLLPGASAPRLKQTRSDAEKRKVILLDDVWKEYRSDFLRRRKQALSGVSLEVRPGEVFGYLGPNGAGKTTTMKLLIGLASPTKGRVLLRGIPSRDHRARQRVGFLPENPYFFAHLTGDELLRFFGRMAGLSGRALDIEVDRVIDVVGLRDARQTLLRRYSKGMMQRAGIGQAIIGDPDLLILDEPMSGLDPIGRREVRDLILRLREEGKTVFLSSHILQDMEALCDRVAIIAGGRLRRVGPLDEILRVKEDELELEVSGLDQALFSRLPTVKGIRREGTRVKLSLERDEYIDMVLFTIRETGGTLESIARRRETLEERFLREVAPQEEPE